MNKHRICPRKYFQLKNFLTEWKHKKENYTNINQIPFFQFKFLTASIPTSLLRRRHLTFHTCSFFSTDHTKIVLNQTIPNSTKLHHNATLLKPIAPN